MTSGTGVLISVLELEADYLYLHICEVTARCFLLDSDDWANLVTSFPCSLFFLEKQILFLNLRLAVGLCLHF